MRPYTCGLTFSVFSRLPITKVVKGTISIRIVSFPREINAFVRPEAGGGGGRRTPCNPPGDFIYIRTRRYTESRRRLATSDSSGGSESMKVGKTTGYDSASSEMLRGGGSIMTSQLHQRFNKCWKSLKGYQTRTCSITVAVQPIHG
ncbi:hypothetical protein EVAR_2311_1 [Eumeta japonica]|uniref:Uncharacterized protein n=1 Tax=Eumeta variegata TaxID=151549 RepID=A0A4C1SIJ9_EUMVA|nr:hypothetical protein EVAR_2311_1 [Eumeta japonica]